MKKDYLAAFLLLSACQANPNSGGGISSGAVSTAQSSSQPVTGSALPFWNLKAGSSELDSVTLATVAHQDSPRSVSSGSVWY